MYVMMSKIERRTSMLENHIMMRNLGYIVDRNYQLEKIEEK